MMLPSIRMKSEGSKTTAIEQWGSLAAMKPELFVNALMCNPGTPTSNADTPKAASSPQRHEGDEQEEGAEQESKDFAGALAAPPAVKQLAMIDLEAAARAAAAAAAQEASAVPSYREEEYRGRYWEQTASQERDAARKRKAEEMGLGELGEDELLAAEILSGSFLSEGISVAPQPPPRTGGSGNRGRGSAAGRDSNAGGAGAREGKRARQASVKAAAAALVEQPSRAKGASRSRPIAGKQALGKASAKAASASVVSRGKASGASKAASIPSSLEDGTSVPTAAWVRKVVSFLETNGQDLLSSICAHYRIDFCGDVSSIRDYSLEQLAHNAIFNPALPKSSGRLPKMLRDNAGVTDWQMTFLKDHAGIYRAVRVAARLNGESFAAQCRCCSYCGSCFSGRFMKPNAMHQQAGGWKEITERTAAGKYSWSSLRGWRLCVPCFTHWASNGTNVNANRPCVEDLMQEHRDLLASETVSDESLDTKWLAFASNQQPSTLHSRHEAAASSPSGPPCAAS